MAIIKKLTEKKAFSLGEMLIVVAILAILAGFGVSAIPQFTRSITQKNLDATARAIYIAAQNHLTVADSAGYPNADDFGKEVSAVPEIYYYIVSADDSSDAAKLNNTNSCLNMMLPIGSIDEDIRSKGSYIIRYRKTDGTVLDVFYADPKSYNFSHTNDTDYDSAMAVRGDENKSARQNFRSLNVVIGYYGTGAADISGIASKEDFKSPIVRIENGDTLSVIIDDYNNGDSLTLHVKSHDRDAESVIMVNGSGAQVVGGNTVPCSNPINTTEHKSYIVTLDDITVASYHFSKMFTNLIPGEDIDIWAESKSPSSLANIGVSVRHTTNSLFGSCTISNSVVNAGSITTADIDVSSFRHFENLDVDVSGFNTLNSSENAMGTINTINVSQTTDLDWTEFCNAFANPDIVRVFLKTGAKSSSNGCLLPIIAEGLIYNGNNNVIKNVKVKQDADSGLFESLTDSRVNNMQLVDFLIISNDDGSAGTLAGSMSNSTVTNVVAFNSSGTTTGGINSANSNAGGLVGKSNGCSYSGCSASLIIQGATNAGGLIGLSNNDTQIDKCYSGGHTINGIYSDYNVIAGENAGGLIGSISGSGWRLTNSYSTCSVKGSYAGGLIGAAANGVSNAINKCYSTGLVSGTTKAGAMFGTLNSVNVSASNYYFSMINDSLPWCGEGSSSNNPIAFDEDIDKYNGFVKYGSDGVDAIPYDSLILAKYKGRYYMPDVVDLGGQDSALNNSGMLELASIHHGDWPMPEIFVVQ